jgi:hypothetical protein
MFGQNSEANLYYSNTLSGVTWGKYEALAPLGVNERNNMSGPGLDFGKIFIISVVNKYGFGKIYFPLFLLLLVRWNIVSRYSEHKKNFLYVVLFARPRSLP